MEQFWSISIITCMDTELWYAWRSRRKRETCRGTKAKHHSSCFLQVGEQELKALEVTQCSHLIEKRDLLSALFSEIAVEAYLSAGLGLGRTRHSDPLREGEVGRKGKGVERTFTPISAAHELEAKVLLHMKLRSLQLQTTLPKACCAGLFPQNPSDHLA